MMYWLYSQIPKQCVTSCDVKVPVGNLYIKSYFVKELFEVIARKMDKPGWPGGWGEHHFLCNEVVEVD